MTVLDGYRIDEKIAEGGFGSVYRAYHVASGEVVALKLLHPHLARDPNMTARFQREAATMAKLRDSHTVATRAVGEGADGTLYIAMELLVGEMLHERMAAAGRMPWRQAVAIVRAICSSLAEAHALGVVHRDLKPANIHLSDDGDFVKVLDFGIVEVRGGNLDDGEDLTRAGMTIGTLDYMSPEQVMDRPCDARSDLYALGVMLYEMVTGVRPYGALTGPQLLAAMLTHSATPMSSVMAVPPALERVVMKCLRRDPRNRPADVHELAAALDVLLGRVPTPVDEDDEATTIAAPPRARPSYLALSLPAPAVVPAPLAPGRAARGSVQALGPRAGWAMPVPMPMPVVAQPMPMPVAPMPAPVEVARAPGRAVLVLAFTLAAAVGVAAAQLL